MWGVLTLECGPRFRAVGGSHDFITTLLERCGEHATRDGVIFGD
jgi:hypothetical protein